MPAKFKVGDKVRFTARACQGLTEDIRRRTRTVVAVAYSKGFKANWYQLGAAGGKHRSYTMWFRSYELYLANEKVQNIGRPKKTDQPALIVRMSRQDKREDGEHSNRGVSHRPTRDMSLSGSRGQ